MPFSEIIGHRRLLDLLARSIDRGTLPPSLIFEGPAGSGKRATAVAVAQAVNCLAPRRPDFDACGECSACTRIARGVHGDILIVEPGDTGAIKIEQVRDIVDRAGYRPFEGKRRVVIVDGADALPATGQSALLKTLEEPPSSSMFILMTSRPDVLLATVRSRCIRLRFAEGAKEEIDADVRELAQDVLAQAAGTDDPERRFESAKQLHPGPSETSAESRANLAAHLRAMSSLLRDVEILATRADVRALANADVRPALERLAPAYGGERGMRAFTAIDRALMALDRNAGVKVVADWLVLQL